MNATPAAPGSSRGRRWFLAGATTVLLFGATHTITVIANFAGIGPDPFKQLEAPMRAAELKTGPFTANMAGLMDILSISYSLLLLFLAAIDLTMLKPAIAAGRLRTLAGLNFGLAAGLFGVSFAFQFPPPMLFALIAASCFLIAMLRARPAALAA